MQIYSIFNSIDGEVNAHHQGVFTTFIRTAGCNLRCDFCDTEYALDGLSGNSITVDAIIKEVDSIGCDKVTITGGEPLLQTELPYLLDALVSSGYRVTVETNGSIVIPSLTLHTAMNVNWVIDYKLEYKDRMYMPNYLELGNRDFVKCVISNPNEFETFYDVYTNLRLKGCIANFALAPSHGIITADTLVGWCKQFKMFDVVINVQLHKLLNLSESA